MEDCTVGAESRLVFLISGQEVSSYTLADAGVAGAPELNSLLMSAADFNTNMEILVSWFAAVRRYANPTFGFSQFSQISDEVSAINGTASWELQIGSLGLELNFDRSLNQYTYTRSTFDLSWEDFSYFVRRLETFWRVNARYELA